MQMMKTNQIQSRICKFRKEIKSELRSLRQEMQRGFGQLLAAQLDEHPPGSHFGAHWLPFSRPSRPLESKLPHIHSSASSSGLVSDISVTVGSASDAESPLIAAEYPADGGANAILS